MAEAVVKRSISLPADLVARIDEDRGDVPLSTWLRRAAESRLDVPPIGGGVRAVTPQVPGSRAAKADVKPRPKTGAR